MNKQNIGDSVYAEMSDYGALVLTVENESGTTDRISLKPQIWRDLIAYARDNWGYEHKRHQAELHAFLQDREKPRQKHNPEWLSQALNEGDGTYKP